VCLLAVLYRVIDDAPLVLAANREEAYARGGLTLDLRPGPVPYVAGLDPAAGGTWLGVNARKLFVAVTNRRKSTVPENPRSRGLLVRDLLALGSARAAADAAARELATGRYAGCNLVCGDAESLWVVHGGDWLRARSLAPGVHVLANGDVNDDTDERVLWAAGKLHERALRTADDALAALRAVATHAGPPVPIVRRGPDRGTVCGTLLSLHDRPRRGRLLHADGPPDTTPYADRTGLLWELEGIAEGGR
jgi:uncharacterized protein with NRDE domain